MILSASGLNLAGRLSEAALDLRPGELVCLVGPNGSGKTSLLHALAGIAPAGGTVSIDGVDPRTAPLSLRIRLLSFLPASRDLKWPLAGRDLIALGGASPEEIERIVAALELEPLAGRRADLLSTGERGRILIARALAPRPKQLLLDEPTANLDPLWRIRLMELLRGTLAETGGAALVAMHDLDAAARYSDRVLVMDGGRIAAEGLDGPHVPAIFGIERRKGEWRPVSRPEDRRSSP